jgi:purine-binding chemotaxis protein CheW
MYRPENFLGMAHTEGLGDYLLLDATTVQQQADLLALSGLNLPHQRGQASSDEESGYPSSVGETLYLTYSAGLELATPLHQVQEIISYPKDFTRLEGGVDAVVGLLSHRDVTVPLVSLARLLGRDLDVDVSSACVLLVVADAGPVGLIVQDLTAIERSQWEEEPGRARDPGPGSSGGQDDLARAVADRRLIRMQAVAGNEGADRMVPLLDLLAIAQALTSAPRRGHG